VTFRPYRFVDRNGPADGLTASAFQIPWREVRVYHRIPTQYLWVNSGKDNAAIKKSQELYSGCCWVHLSLIVKIICLLCNFGLLEYSFQGLVFTSFGKLNSPIAETKLKQNKFRLDYKKFVTYDRETLYTLR